MATSPTPTAPSQQAPTVQDNPYPRQIWGWGGWRPNPKWTAWNTANGLSPDGSTRVRPYGTQWQKPDEAPPAGYQPPPESSTAGPSYGTPTGGYSAPTGGYHPTSSMTPSGAPTGGSAAGAGGVLSQPGSYENWYKDNASKLTGQRQLPTYFQGVQGQFSGGKVPPTGTRDAYGAAYPTLSTQMKGAGTAYGASSQLYGTTGAGETAAHDAGNYFRTTGQGENYIKGVMDSGYFNTPGEMERNYNTNSGFYMTRGQGVQNAYGMLDQFKAPGVAESNYGNAKTALSGINYGRQAVSDTERNLRQNGNFAVGYWQSPDTQRALSQNPLADEYKYFAPGLRNKSYSEQMMDSGTGGLIDPYARAQQKRSRDIDNALAARGLFNTGAGLRAQEELSSDIAASEAKDRIALANQADQARNARTGQALDFTHAIDAAAQGRLGLGGQFAAAADASTRGNAAINLNAAQLASQEGLHKVEAETNAADIAERNMVDRLFRGGQLGLQADERDLARVTAGADAADRAQRAGYTRTMGGIDTATGLQNLGRQRTLDLMGAGKQEQDLGQGRLDLASRLGISADTDELSRIQQLFAGGGQLDEKELASHRQDIEDILKMLGIIGGIDDKSHQDILDQGTAAGTNQDYFQNREHGQLTDAMNLGGAMSRLAETGLDRASSEQFQTQLEQIQLLLTQGKLSVDQANQKVEEVLAAAKAYAQSRAKPPGGTTTYPAGTES